MSHNNKLKGNIKEATGKVQKKAGEILGNKDLEEEGRRKEVEGKVQKHVGELEDGVKEARKNIEDKLD